MAIMRNNNNFMNQNNQIQSYSNNENSERIRKEEEENHNNQATQGPLTANHDNHNRDSNNDHNFRVSENQEGSGGGRVGVPVCAIFFICFLSILLGMINFGVNNKIPFMVIFGIFDIIIFVICLVLLILNDKIILFNVYSSTFFYSYIITIGSVMFLFAFSFCIMDSCHICGERINLGFIIIFLNTIMWGLGTLIYGLSKIFKNGLTKWNIIRDIIFGIIQLIGFILFLYCIFLLPFEKNNYSKIITLIIFGCLSYCFSLYSGINIYKELKNN